MPFISSHPDLFALSRHTNLSVSSTPPTITTTTATSTSNLYNTTNTNTTTPTTVNATPVTSRNQQSADIILQVPTPTFSLAKQSALAKLAMSGQRNQASPISHPLTSSAASSTSAPVDHEHLSVLPPPAQDGGLKQSPTSACHQIHSMMRVPGPIHDFTDTPNRSLNSTAPSSPRM